MTTTDKATALPPLTRLYVTLRRAARNFVISHPAIDRRIGRSLVRIDVALHERGILGHLKRQDRFIWKGFTLFYGPSDINLINQLYLHGQYEIATQRFFEEALGAGMTFVDLGAHIGLFSLFVSRLVGPSGKVFAFEPSPTTRRLLKRNLEANAIANVELAEYAVSNQRGQVRFVDHPMSEASSVAQPGETEHLIDVEAISLDEYFEKRGWPPVDVVKMDIEGQELNAMRGMTELVTRNPRIKVVFEYNKGQLERCQIDTPTLFEVLRAMGFTRFAALFREHIPLDLPSQMSELDKIANRANVNILAEK